MLATANDPDGASFGWGVIGPGGIARRFVEAVQAMSGVQIAGVWGRSPERAAGFVRECCGPASPGPRVHRTLEEFLDDDTIDAAYISTPHDSHEVYARACLERGIPVLCEKPMTPTLAQTAALVAFARERRVFLVEALWTVFLPIYAQVAAWLRAGRIGEPRTLESSFCFEVPYAADSRLFSLEKAGGSLLDIGIYNLAVTRFVLQAATGACPEPLAMDAQGQLAATGADRHVDGLLRFAGDVVSRFSCGFDRSADNRFRILGSKGEITVDAGFWCATRARLSCAGEEVELAELPWKTNGFEYEIEDAMRSIRQGRIESAVMPHAESLGLVGWMDALRSQLGVRYPFEP